MKNIGILTFHASHNYGSMLQAYALQHYLQSQGHHVEIINLRPLNQKKMYENPNVLSGFSIKKIGKTILYPILTYNDIKKWKLFESFIHDYLKVSEKEYSTYKEIQTDLFSKKIDILISGGDQIWNQKCSDFELSYFLPFNLEGVKKISYAPSMGKNALDMKKTPYVENMMEYLKYYNFISVREPDAADVLSSLLGKKVDVVPDPTFLLDKSEYEKILPEKPLIDGKYLFYYTPSHLVANKSFKAAQEFARKNGLKFVSSTVRRNQRGVIQVNASGPIQFLNLLRHAEFVCGQSFHLLVFSLLYHKEFAILDGDKDPRMMFLLKNCNIPNRGVNINNPDFSRMEYLNYKEIDEFINKFKQKAISFLIDALN